MSERRDIGKDVDARPGSVPAPLCRPAYEHGRLYLGNGSGSCVACLMGFAVLGESCLSGARIVRDGRDGGEKGAYGIVIERTRGTEVGGVLCEVCKGFMGKMQEWLVRVMGCKMLSMKIILANPRGFCAGVNMAIETVDEALKIVGTPLYVYHEIVHNRHVVESFKKQGVVFVDSIEEVPNDSTVIFSAHGVSPEVRGAAKARNCTMIDATCPLVTKVHMEAIRYAKQGYKLLLVGHAGHDEVVGTVGEAPDAFSIVESPEDVEKLPFSEEEQGQLVYLTQTTLSMDDANVIIDAIKRRYPGIKQPPSEDICYATTNRQLAVRALAEESDLVLVVGSKNSSNSVRLTEISENAGTRAYLVDDVSEIDHVWFNGVESVLITAGASAPEHLVEEIVKELIEKYEGLVDESHIVEEDVHFNLPRSLRVLQESCGKGNGNNGCGCG
ncbi:4-hydroxy-3-methylbut-2-enyl diphosphate reductase [Poriferisphaera corsica]|nr:4-hydroxy-3-methylbut-2-enyl diphosphate reductase [Poriferisphaera corsica]